MCHYILDISSLSTCDFVNLCAHYMAILRDEKDQENTLKNRGYSPEALVLVNKKKSMKTTDILGLRFSKPLIKFKYAALSEVLVYFENYERGNLPFPGTISEQPAQIIEIFNVVSSLRLLRQKEIESQNAKRGK